MLIWSMNRRSQRSQGNSRSRLAGERGMTRETPPPASLSHVVVALCALSVLVALDPAGVHPVLRRHQGHSGAQSGFLHADAEAGGRAGRRHGQRDRRHRDVDGARRAVRDPDRHHERHLHVGVSGHAAGVGRPIRRRHAERRAVDCDRRVRLRHRGAADGAVHRCSPAASRSAS